MSSSSPLAFFHGIRIYAFAFLLCSCATVRPAECSHYTSMFNFGDSITDTGNALYSMGGASVNLGRLPYGETFFQHPTGRFTDGRVVVDFIAEALGIPLLPPYVPSQSEGADLNQGANFAFGGATALDPTFLAREYGVLSFVNNSLGVQMDWFKDLLRSICRTKADCKEALNRTLVMMSMEGNDYNFALSGGKDKLLQLVHPVVSYIGYSIRVLAELGATSIVASGMLPIGCLTDTVITYGAGPKESPKQLECVGWVNDIVKKHNHELRRELGKIQRLHPDVNIMYADFYSATVPIYNSPERFGFVEGPFVVCCGPGRGGLNYDGMSDSCGFGEVKKSCDDPSTRVSWDGLHLTEAAYRIMADGLLERSCNFSVAAESSCPHNDDDQGITLMKLRQQQEQHDISLRLEL